MRVEGAQSLSESASVDHRPMDAEKHLEDTANVTSAQHDAYETGGSSPPKGKQESDEKTVQVSIRTKDILNTKWVTRDEEMRPDPKGELLTNISYVTKSFLGERHPLTGRRRIATSLRDHALDEDDLLQAGLEKLIRSLPHYKGASNLNTYSKTVVKNGLLDLVDRTRTDKRKANTDTHSLALDGDVQESQDGHQVKPLDHEADLLRGHAQEPSRCGWHPGMEEEDRLDSLSDHALLALVDEVPDGTAAWWKMADRESWEIVAGRMGTTVATARKRIPAAWAEVLEITEVVGIVTTALRRRMVNP